jgi:NhaP-type Na+/H+ or K+/H+ antiporter
VCKVFGVTGTASAAASLIGSCMDCASRDAWWEILVLAIEVLAVRVVPYLGLVVGYEYRSCKWGKDG